jgi:hypothetical protein
LKLVLDGMGGTYDGLFTSDGSSIEGAWTQRQPLPLVLRRATPETAWKDPAPHTIQFVTIYKNVKLEVLDFGGSGRPLVFLAGMGNTAHVFDRFAPKFTTTHQVYAITRRLQQNYRQPNHAPLRHRRNADQALGQRAPFADGRTP